MLQKGAVSHLFTSDSKTWEYLKRKLKLIFEEFQIYGYIFGISCNSGANINEAEGEFPNLNEFYVLGIGLTLG